MNSTMRRTTGGLVAAALAGTAFVAAPAAQAAPERDRPTSLARVLAADGHRFDRTWGDFDVLDAAVMAVLDAKPASPVGVLTKARTRLTAFLPTDRAFRHLATVLTGTRPRTEKATFRALARAAGIDVVESVLLYHVVPGKTLTAAKVVRADGRRLKTAEGSRITVRVNGKRVTLRDADPDQPNPRVIRTNINRGNPQIAHAVNGVLLPFDL
jgi:hypothetical protein